MAVDDALKRGRMPTIHLKETTTSTPEQFVAGLTDFGPGGLELFGGVVLGIFGKRVLGKTVKAIEAWNEKGRRNRELDPEPLRRGNTKDERSLKPLLER
jgi:hypothetical protein